MQNHSNGLRFDVYERVHLPDSLAAIHELDEIELVPRIQVEQHGEQVMLKGHLLLSGVYRAQNDTGTTQFLEHRIPVEITLPMNRVGRLDDISVEIDNFDVDLLSARTLNITGVLSLYGIVLEQPSEQESWQREEPFTVVHDRESEPKGIQAAGEPDAQSVAQQPARFGGWAAPSTQSFREAQQREAEARESARREAEAREAAARREEEARQSAQRDAEIRGGDQRPEPFHEQQWESESRETAPFGQEFLREPERESESRETAPFGQEFFQEPERESESRETSPFGQEFFREPQRDAESGGIAPFGREFFQETQRDAESGGIAPFGREFFQETQRDAESGGEAPFGREFFQETLWEGKSGDIAPFGHEFFQEAQRQAEARESTAFGREFSQEAHEASGRETKREAVTSDSNGRDYEIFQPAEREAGELAAARREAEALETFRKEAEAKEREEARRQTAQRESVLRESALQESLNRQPQQWEMAYLEPERDKSDPFFSGSMAVPSFAPQEKDRERQPFDFAVQPVQEPQPLTADANSSFGDVTSAETDRSRKEMRIALGSKPVQEEQQPDLAGNGISFRSLLQSSKKEQEARSAAEQTPKKTADAEARPSGDEIEWKNLFLGGAGEESFRRVRICIVQREETLDTIAGRYHLQPREIALYNRLTDQNVSEGQMLYIP